MNLYVQYKLKTCGKSKFLTRLIPELDRLGVKVQFEEKGADVALLISRCRGKFPKIPTVVRMDGITLLDTKDERDRLRNKIRPSVNKCNAIIYQSEFCRRMLNGILKPKVKKQYVIFNGANIQDYFVKPAESDKLQNVLISSKWFDGKNFRYHKRLREMWEVAVEYCSMYSGDTKFWIAGETGGEEKHWPKHDSIEFLGHLDSLTLKRYYVLCDVMLYLAWYDWCPNQVIEVLCAGVPVVCNNNGGVPEIVKNNGIICNIDVMMPTKRIASNMPPAFNRLTVLENLRDVLHSPPNLDIWHVNIRNVAKQYKKVFEEVLK